MDARFLKWMGETMARAADDLSAAEKFQKDWGLPDWTKMWTGTGSPPPSGPGIDPESVLRMRREWLTWFAAVPKEDYEALEIKVAALEAEIQAMRVAMTNLSVAITGMKEIPSAVKPWLELMTNAADKQIEWWTELVDARKANAK